eukprot:366148-Chlamydomonas_euryale.AAC.2
MPQLPRGLLSQVDKAVTRGQRPMCQKVVKTLITRTPLIGVVGAASSRARAWRCVAAVWATAAVPATLSLSLPLPRRSPAS